MKNLFLFVVLVFFMFSCSTVRMVKPLNKGETEVGVALGGPIIGFGKVVLPVPMSSVAVSHGFSDRLTAFGGLNTTSLLFGVGQLDLGAGYGILEQDGYRPGLVGLGTLSLAFDKWDKNFRAHPQLDLHTYWDYKEGKGTLYSGVSNWFELSNRQVNSTEQNDFWAPNIYLGTKLNGAKLNWLIETRYIAPNYKNNYTVVDWKGIGAKGAFGLYFGVTKTF